KILMNWLPIEYDLSFKIMAAATIGAVFFLHMGISRMGILPQLWRKYLNPLFNLLCGISFLSVLLFSWKTVLPIYNSLVSIAVICLLIGIGYALFSQFKGIGNNFSIVLALIAIINH